MSGETKSISSYTRVFIGGESCVHGKNNGERSIDIQAESVVTETGRNENGMPGSDFPNAELANGLTKIWRKQVASSTDRELGDI